MANPNPPTAHLKRDAGPGRPKGSHNKLNRTRIETELRYLALSDPLALFDRVAKGKRSFRLREIQEMSEGMRRCIASVKVRTENLTAGDDAQDTVVQVTLWDKVRALELCARALGMLKDKIEVTASDELISRLDRAKLRAREHTRG